ncbi:MAG: PH domain-containing protein [Candidatus Bathyarchaeota archaeon]
MIIKTTKLIGGSKIIPLTDVKSVKKTLIPFGLRLFGASFHGGYYHIPNLGRAFLTITNFKDGLLIETSKNRYIITPSNPEKFKNLIEKSKV